MRVVVNAGTPIGRGVLCIFSFPLLLERGARHRVRGAGVARLGTGRGVDRTVRSIEVRASRIHVSLAVQQVCPECGVVGLRLNRQSGLCPKCTELMHLNEEIAFNEILQAEREAASDEEAIAGIRRERDKMRQRNSRLARKYGLPGKRTRGL